MQPERLLVWNLADPQYVELVLDGSLENLTSAIARSWNATQAMRKERTAPTTDHPMPAGKKHIRIPQFLATIKQAITKLVQLLSPEPSAA